MKVVNRTTGPGLFLDLRKNRMLKFCKYLKEQWVMRVIAGGHKGRRLIPPKGQGLRPTSARVREALFSILRERTTGARFLDLFAGTGAIGIEALSRGAQSATFVEPIASSLKVLRANLDRCGLIAPAKVHACTAETFLRRQQASEGSFDIIFADPPYHEDIVTSLLSAIDQAGIMAPDSIVVLEHFTKISVPPKLGRLVLRRRYQYGDTSLSVYNVHDQREPSP